MTENQVIELLEGGGGDNADNTTPNTSEFEAITQKALQSNRETETDVASVNNQNMASQITRGYRPYYSRNLYGKQVLKYSKRPVAPIPKLIIVEHYRVCSYLGDYGAGKTLKTFSLLPGEKTEITIKSYKNTTETKTKSENILDSFSENSANELEQLIEDESQNSATVGSEETSTETENNNYSIKGGVSIGVKWLNLKAKLDAEKAGNTGTTFSNTVNSTRSDNMKQLNRAMDRHVAESSAVREVTVNTESTQTIETGEETQVTRVLENINKSRVLNFVFRQLLQEYFTVVYLDDVSILYSNGYPESKRVVKLDGLEGLLAEIIPDAANQTAIRDKILNELSSVYDYQGNRVRFVEKVSYDIVDINDNQVETQHYFRKKQGLSQTYRNKTVPGIILDVKHRMLRTDSVIVDALLGQGEALDCFNVKLQEAANMKAYLENFMLYLEQLEKTQAMEVIDQIEDPQLKGELYQKVLGTCCASNVVVPLGHHHTEEPSA